MLSSKHPQFRRCKWDVLIRVFNYLINNLSNFLESHPRHHSYEGKAELV